MAEIEGAKLAKVQEGRTKLGIPVYKGTVPLWVSLSGYQRIVGRVHGNLCIMAAAALAKGFCRPLSVRSCIIEPP
jgi:hypothetical protein